MKNFAFFCTSIIALVFLFFLGAAIVEAPQIGGSLSGMDLGYVYAYFIFAFLFVVFSWFLRPRTSKTAAIQWFFITSILAIIMGFFMEITAIAKQGGYRQAILEIIEEYARPSNNIYKDEGI